VRPPRALHIVLSLVGIAGLFLFVTACMPSWSPDGSQLVFDYANPTSKEGGVALYDTATGKATSIYTYRGKGQNQPNISAQWREDGRTILAFVYDDSAPSEERSFIAEVAPNGDLVRIIKLNSTECYFAPAPELRGVLYLWGDHPLEVNLATGESKEIKDLSSAYFFRANDQIAYVAKPEGDDDNTKDLFLIGTLESDSSQPHNQTEFHVPNTRESEYSNFVFPPATDRTGRVALPIAREDQTAVIMICDNQGLRHTIEPKLAAHTQLGNLQWSPDGGSLYAGLLGTVKKNKSVWSIAEINAETGEVVRVIPVSQMDASQGDVDSDFYMHFPIALSPDGRTIATNLAGAPEKSISESDRALYLLDLNGDSAKVTKITPPVAK
jgi:dipeptidyl aminopeptidase/acylaminoacyl peptidase